MLVHCLFYFYKSDKLVYSCLILTFLYLVIDLMVQHLILVTFLQFRNDFFIISTPSSPDRTQAVKIRMSFFSASKLLFGVPQASVLGPTLFSLHSSSIADIDRKHGLGVHLYADDTQIYIMFNQDDTVNDISRIVACVAGTKSWMITNKLLLNGDKL